MTDNQVNQLFDLVTKCVNGIQRLEEGQKRLEGDVAELKGDVAELKDGQKRIEKEMRLNNQSVNQIAGEQVRMNNRITDLERASV